MRPGWTKPKAWNPRDETYLRRFYVKLPLDRIARKLRRTPASVRSRAKKLRLCRRHFYTPAEIAILRKLYPNRLTEEVARRLGLTICQINGTAHRLGLHKSREFLRLLRHQQGLDVGRFGIGVAISAWTHSSKQRNAPAWLAHALLQSALHGRRATGGTGGNVQISGNSGADVMAASKKQAVSPLRSRPRMPEKRLDASVGVPDVSDLPRRTCQYAKCADRLRGRTFQPKRRAQIFCSPQCRKAHWMDANYIRIPKNVEA